jgi:hypothetical protein
VGHHAGWPRQRPAPSATTNSSPTKPPSGLPRPPRPTTSNEPGDGPSFSRSHHPPLTTSPESRATEPFARGGVKFKPWGSGVASAGAGAKGGDPGTWAGGGDGGGGGGGGGVSTRAGATSKPLPLRSGAGGAGGGGGGSSTRANVAARPRHDSRDRAEREEQEHIGSPSSSGEAAAETAAAVAVEGATEPPQGMEMLRSELAQFLGMDAGAMPLITPTHSEEDILEQDNTSVFGRFVSPNRMRIGGTTAEQQQQQNRRAADLVAEHSRFSLFAVSDTAEGDGEVDGTSAEEGEAATTEEASRMHAAAGTAPVLLPPECADGASPFAADTRRLSGTFGATTTAAAAAAARFGSGGGGGVGSSVPIHVWSARVRTAPADASRGVRSDGSGWVLEGESSWVHASSAQQPVMVEGQTLKSPVNMPTRNSNTGMMGVTSSSEASTQILGDLEATTSATAAKVSGHAVPFPLFELGAHLLPSTVCLLLLVSDLTKLTLARVQAAATATTRGVHQQHRERGGAWAGGSGMTVRRSAMHNSTAASGRSLPSNWVLADDPPHADHHRWPPADPRVAWAGAGAVVSAGLGAAGFVSGGVGWGSGGGYGGGGSGGGLGGKHATMVAAGPSFAALRVAGSSAGMMERRDGRAALAVRRPSYGARSSSGGGGGVLVAGGSARRFPSAHMAIQPQEESVRRHLALQYHLTKRR